MVQVLGPEIDRGGKNATQKKPPAHTSRIAASGNGKAAPRATPPSPPQKKKIGPALGTKALSRTHKLTIFSSLAP